MQVVWPGEWGYSGYGVGGRPHDRWCGRASGGIPPVRRDPGVLPVRQSFLNRTSGNCVLRRHRTTVMTGSYGGGGDGGRTVWILRNPDELAARADELIASAAREALRERGRFTLVLAGGSTPERTYRVLAGGEAERSGGESAKVGGIDWLRTTVVFGDERLVSPDDPRSNYRMARAALLEPAGVPPLNVLPIPTDGTAEACAAEYDRMLHERFGNAGRPPRFDLVLLGLGEDGHTASLLPGAAAREGADAWVTGSPPGKLPPPVDRITLTYPVLNAAREVLFLVAGESKAAVVRDVLEGVDGRPADRRERPAAGVGPEAGKATWLLDEAAGSLLTRTL